MVRSLLAGAVVGTAVIGGLLIPTYRATSAGPSEPFVYVVGDSLALGPALEHDFPDSWEVDAENGRPLADAMFDLRRSAAAQPDCVVIALGTNDVHLRRTRQQMAADIARAERILAEVECLFWTTVKVEDTVVQPDWPVYAQTWNDLLRHRARGTVIDWNAVAAEQPDWFLADGVHQNREGRAGYADLIAQAVPVDRPREDALGA
jgi:lysophospholipase L1-like esterase